MNNEKVEIFEATEYKDEVTSIKQIVLSHIKKISNIVCQELTPGYWEKKPMKVGNGLAMAETYQPDLRFAYCNSVAFLVDLIYPLSDAEFKTAVNTFWEVEEKENKTEEQIYSLLKASKKIFREANIMFERTNFFDSTEGVTE